MQRSNIRRLDVGIQLEKVGVQITSLLGTGRHSKIERKSPTKARRELIEVRARRGHLYKINKRNRRKHRRIG